MNTLWIERFREPSTWRGMVMLMTAFGVSISPDTVTDVVAVGTGVSGLIGVLTGDTRP
ncbi:MAG: hypothetical protein HQL97_08585 [Magnetococcales bacterium]|nr:hypothetical protein [Magnetococcales bacterium]MBF0261873.1 hypothetical protein [Magnetococcales bacterium]